MRATTRWSARVIGAAVVLAAVVARADAPTIFGRPLERGGFHFQFSLGYGGGPTSSGVLHSMEVGGTFRDGPVQGLTLAYDHVFVFSKGVPRPIGGSDLFGGHMLIAKVPLWCTELVGKVGLGFGENVDLSSGFSPRFGVGWLYGVDLDLALGRTSGLTLGVLAFQTVTGDRGHQFAGGLLLGYTWF